jgi:hypothetical protein
LPLCASRLQRSEHAEIAVAKRLCGDDSRSGSLMLPPPAETRLDRIGREALYELGEIDD